MRANMGDGYILYVFGKRTCFIRVPNDTKTDTHVGVWLDSCNIKFSPSLTLAISRTIVKSTGQVGPPFWECRARVTKIKYASRFASLENGDGIL